MANSMNVKENSVVFADLTQDELDRAYDQDNWAANAAEVQARIVARSRQVAGEMPPQTRRYGPAEQQCIDIFAPAGAKNAPVFILIHGGAWRLSMRQGFYSSAPSFTTEGCILAVMGFGCLPAISMVEMAEQIRQGVLWVASQIGAFGGDSDNLHIIGHSSGAHLAAVTLTSDLGAAAPCVRGGTLISGLYDLEPVMLSSRRHYIDLTKAEAERLSPIRHLKDFTGVGSVWWGSHESPEFARQSAVFADALRDAGKLGKSAKLVGRNHFEMLEALDDPKGPLIEAMIGGARR
jgi:arylformamidase